MKRNILSLLVFTAIFTCTTNTHAQVGIGTNSPNASAQLEVNSASKGFLPPRVALTSTNSASPVTSPATGLLVYNTATAGTSPNNVTPGYYFYDGSKWQRLINQQPDATVEFNTTDPGTGSPTFTPNITQSRDVIYVSTVDGSQWSWNGTSYVSSVPAATTPWQLSGGSTDAGGNKSSTIYRSGSVGIGATTTPAASAQLDVNSTTKGFLPPRMTNTQRSAIASPAAGLMVYQTDANSGNYVYNGTSWQLISNANIGDIKTGMQASDHNGWIRLNGRAKSTLTASQQAQATALGIGANLPDASNAYLVQNGTTLGSVSGSNQRTIAQANLPNYNLPTATTSSAGSHSHTLDPGPVTTSTDGNHSHTGSVGGSNWNGGGAYAGGFSSGPFVLNIPTLTINSAGDHAHSVDIPSTNSSTVLDHSHTVTVSSGGSGTAINIAPMSLSVNTFIYLGN